MFYFCLKEAPIMALSIFSSAVFLLSSHNRNSGIILADRQTKLRYILHSFV